MYVAGNDPHSIVKDTVFDTPMFFVTAMVDGDRARDLLLHNRKPEKDKAGTNRKPSPTTIRKYKLLMLSNQWYLSPQPIILSETEEGFEVSDMNDGQQRLMALVEASLTKPELMVPFTFAFNAPRASKWLLDQGRRRGPGDFLAMAGEVNANQLSYAVRMLYAVTKQRPFQSISIWRSLEMTPQAYTAFLDEHGDLRYALQQARDLKSLVSPYVGAVLFFLMHREYGVYKTNEFFSGMATGANLSTDDPRLKTREFLALRAREKYKWDGFEMLALLIATVNAWLTGHERFVARTAFSKLSKSYPVLLTQAELPTTEIVPGNNPATS